MTQAYLEFLELAHTNTGYYDPNKIISKGYEEIRELIDAIDTFIGLDTDDIDLIGHSYYDILLELYDVLFQDKMIEIYNRDCRLSKRDVEHYNICLSELVEHIVDEACSLVDSPDRLTRENFLNKVVYPVGNIKYTYRFKLRSKLMAERHLDEEEAWLIVKEKYKHFSAEYLHESNFILELSTKGYHAFF